MSSITGVASNCAGSKAPQLTTELECIGENLREIHMLIEEITSKLHGPRVMDCNAKEAAPWPPQLSIWEWVESSGKAVEDARCRLRDIMQSL